MQEDYELVQNVDDDTEELELDEQGGNTISEHDISEVL